MGSIMRNFPLIMLHLSGEFKIIIKIFREILLFFGVADDMIQAKYSRKNNQ